MRKENDQYTFTPEENKYILWATTTDGVRQELRLLESQVEFLIKQVKSIRRAMGRTDVL